MSAWYYVKDGKPCGPLSGKTLRKLAVTGRIKPTDLVCKQGMHEWVRADAVPGLLPAQGSSHVAIWIGVVVIAALLLLAVLHRRGGIDPEKQLMHAIETQDVEALMQAVEQGADPNIHQGKPLVYAVKEGNVRMVNYLLHKDASQNIQAIPPLHIAIFTKNNAIVRALLGRGANRNVWAQREGESGVVDDVFAGNTPLHIAVRVKSPRMVELLLREGAKPALQNQSGMTPREMLQAMASGRELDRDEIEIFTMLQYAEERILEDSRKMANRRRH